MADDEGSHSQVKIQFSTADTSLSLPESTGPILVNTNLRRYALSTLVNHLLSTSRPVPLEFLINGAYLRSSLHEFLKSNGISTETVLTVEYVRAIVPPIFQSSFPHDDWVGAVDVISVSSRAGQVKGGGPGESAINGLIRSGQEEILTGGYDGRVRLWNLSGETIATSPAGYENGGHTSGIKATRFLSATRIASAGYDRTIRVWKHTSEDPDPPSQASTNHSLLPTLELFGHKSTISSLDVHPPSARILSASDDHTVGLWSSKKSSSPTAPTALLPQSSARNAAKRRKTAVSTPQRGPLAQLRGHTGPVAASCFSPVDSTVAYSASHDRAVRTWDLTTAACVDTRTTSHPLLSLLALPKLGSSANGVLAAGSAARHVSLLDPRVSAATTSIMTLRGHSNAVVALAPDPGCEYRLLSGSHDGTCRVWDVRSRRAGGGEDVGGGGGAQGDCVYVINRESSKTNGDNGKKIVGGEGIKVFDVCWDKEVGILSVGEDRQVQINQNVESGSESTRPSE